MTNASFEAKFPPGPKIVPKNLKLYNKNLMDSHFFCEDSNHSISSWNHLKFTASSSPEIVPGVSDTEAAKAATGKPAAESMAMLPVDEDEELETAYDTVMLDCQRVAVRIARAWPDPGGWTTVVLCSICCLLTRRIEDGNGS